MSKTVVGLYDDASTADDVVDALFDRGFDRDNVHVEGHGGHGTGSFDGDVVSGLTSRGIPDEDARFYGEGVRRGGTLVMIEADEDRIGDVSEVMNKHRPVQMERRREHWREEDDYSGYDPDADPYTEEQVAAERDRYDRSEEEVSVPVVEEEVKVGKRSVERGGVRIHTRVREEAVEEDVTVRDEEIDVEEHRVDRELSPEEADAAFQEQDVEMTETDEEVVVDKKARQTGEVTARKTATDRTETVRETVRKTEVDVEDIGRGERRHDSAVAFENVGDEYREHYRSNYGDGSYEDYEPAYRFGHRYASDETYASRDYADVEPEIRRDYEERHGKGTWDKVKDAVRHGYTRTRSRY